MSLCGTYRSCCRLAFAIGLSIAQVVPGRAQLLPIRNYTTREGLNANGIYALLRDSKGVLWVGTYNGVNWYDGSQFLQPAMNTRSGQIYVTNLKEDSAKQVWVTSWYSGLYKFADGKFTNYLPDTLHVESQSNSIFDFLELGSGRYLAATDQNVWLFDGRAFSIFDPANTELRQQVLTLAKTRRGDILIGFGKGVLWYRRKGSGWFCAGKLFGDTGANRILSDGDGCWIATSRGLLYYPDIAAALDKQPGADPRFYATGPVECIFMDREKNFWYIVNGAVHKFNSVNRSGPAWRSDGPPGADRPAAEQVYTMENGLPSAVIRSIFADPEGITWLGTDNGLAKLNENYYRFFPLQDDRQNETSIIAISHDKPGHLWVGSYDGIYRMQDTRAIEIRPGPRDRTHGDGHTGFTFCMTRDREGLLWACTGTGVYTIGPAGSKRMSEGQMSAICTGDDGAIWFGGTDGRVYRLVTPGARIVEVANPAYLDEKINAIGSDPDGTVWIGYALSGMRRLRFEPGKGLTLLKVFSGNTGYSNLRIRSFCDDHRGHLLVGTRTDGAYIFDKHGDRLLTHFNTGNGLGGNWIKAAVLGGSQIYLATNNGLDIINAGNYTARPRHIAFRNEAVPAEFSAVFLQGDTVWLGTSKGLLEYTPSRQQKDTLPPPVYVMKVTIDGMVDSNILPFSGSSLLPDLSYGQNSIAFDFAGLSFLDEENVRYSYRMEGLDKDWSPVTDRRYVNYTHLSPGKYRFRVSAQNTDGIWSEVPASIAFVIATPFWQAWWFIALVVVVVATLMYSFYRYRLRQALNIERLRVKISTDLHDDIGSTLSSISILSDIVLREKGRDPGKGMVQEIKDSSISLMEKMDDIVWSINPRNDELESLMLRIKRFAAQLFEAKGIDYEIDIENNIRHLKLPMEHRQNVYLIMKEAINNLVKYANAGRAYIRAGSEGSLLKVQISDDGKGFLQDQRPGGNGIVNMRNRAGLMGATLTLHSTPGSGTTVILTLKMK